MAIDPSIPLSGRPAQIQSPLASLAAVQQMRNQQAEGEALAEQRRAIAEQRRQQMAQQQQQMDAVERSQQESEALNHLFASGSPSPEAIYSVVGPERGTKIIEGIQAAQALTLKRTTDARESFAKVVAGIKAWPEAQRAEAYDGLAKHFTESGLIDASQLPPYSPEGLDALEQSLLTPDKRYDQTHPKPVSMAPGSSLVNPQTGETVASLPSRPTPPIKVETVEGGRPVSKFVTPEAGQSYPLYVKPEKAAASGGDELGNVKEAVAGMVDGSVPPQLPGRASKDYTAILAEAHRQGYDLAKAATDWTATQKHFATLNGSQQTRLRQAAETAYHSLDVIDELAAKWDGGRFPLLNRATLATAKAGGLGRDAQTIATQLDAQISDLTSELGNVYMGGNSPTDHALSLAGKNLSADWSKSVLQDMTKLARTNLKIRLNSMSTIGAVTTGSQAPVAAPAAMPGASYQDYLKSKGR